MDRVSHAVLVAACLMVCACDRQPRATPSTDHPPTSSLPADILRGLNTDESVLACFAGAPGAPIIVQPDWFGTRRVDLDGDGQRDWLVEALDPCLRSANGTTWVYLTRADGHRLAARIDAVVAVAAARFAGATELIEGKDGGGRRYRYADDTFAAVPALASSYTGEWRALSAAYFEFDPLHIGAQSMNLGRCADLAFDIVDARAEHVRLVVSMDSCRLGDETIAVMDLAVGKRPCQMEMTLYGSRAAAQNADLLAWGVFERPSCP